MADERKFKVGQRIVATSGAFKGREGVITDVMPNSLAPICVQFDGSTWTQILSEGVIEAVESDDLTPEQEAEKQDAIEASNEVLGLLFGKPADIAPDRRSRFYQTPDVPSGYMRPCDTCGGKGTVNAGYIVPCPVCEGTGIQPPDATPPENTCPRCYGKGYQGLRIVCPRCNGTGTDQHYENAGFSPDAQPQDTITPDINTADIFAAVDAGRIEAHNVDWQKVARALRTQLDEARAALEAAQEREKAYASALDKLVDSIPTQYTLENSELAHAFANATLTLVEMTRKALRGAGGQASGQEGSE